jgi:hypothetical protein
MTMPTPASVDKPSKHPLVAARDFGEIPSGARVALTSGRQTAISRSDEPHHRREIALCRDDSWLPHPMGTVMTSASRAVEVETVVPCAECMALQARRSRI